MKELQKSRNPNEKLAKMPPIYYKMTIDFGGKIVDIGQITKQERAQLQSLRKRGIVIRYDDYTFPRVKNGWFVATTGPGSRPARDQALEASLASLKQGAWQYVPEAQLKVARRLKMQLARNNPAGDQKARTEAEIEQAKRRWDADAPDKALAKVRLLPRKEERRQARELPLPNPNGKPKWVKVSAFGGGKLYRLEGFTKTTISSNVFGRWALHLGGQFYGTYPSLPAARQGYIDHIAEQSPRNQNPFIEPIIYGAGLGLGLAGAQIGLKKILNEKNPMGERRGGPLKPRTPDLSPLQKVIKRKGKWEKLECGHWILPPEGFTGMQRAKRRRCYLCVGGELSLSEWLMQRRLEGMNPTGGRRGQVVKTKPHKALWGSWCHKCHKPIAQGSQMVIYAYQTEGRKPVEHAYHVKCDPGG